MSTAQTDTTQERRARDRSLGILLRRRQNRLAEIAEERRRKTRSGFDIAAALELHLDQVTTRRGMIALLESWLNESTQGEDRDEDYVQAIERAIRVIKTAPDLQTGIAMLQRASD